LTIDHHLKLGKRRLRFPHCISAQEHRGVARHAECVTPIGIVNPCPEQGPFCGSTRPRRWRCWRANGSDRALPSGLFGVCEYWPGQCLRLSGCLRDWPSVPAEKKARPCNRRHRYLPTDRYIANCEGREKVGQDVSLHHDILAGPLHCI